MRWLKFLSVVGSLALVLALTPKTAQARCCACDMTDNEAAEASRVIADLTAHVTNEHDQTRQQLTDFENRLMDWLDNWWDNEFRPSLEDLGEHLNVQLIEHARIIGTFFDAQNQILVQKSLQEATLEAGRRYRPHDYGCVAGTVIGGLPRAAYATSAMRATLNIDNIARTFHNINSGNQYDFSQTQDIIWRWQEFIDHFCDPDQNLEHLPGGASWPATADSPACGSGSWTKKNGDVLVGETLLDNPTIETEEELRTAIVLARNLINPNVLNPIPESALRSSTGKTAFMERRSMEARRQVAQDAINAMIARRVTGSRAAGEVRDLMLQVGIPQSQIPAGWNPSQYELMEVITKRRFWDPEYFVRLQTDPENVAREQAILSAFNLMQERENFELMEHIGLMLAIQISAYVER